MSKKNQCMVDLETMGVATDAAITQIGAVVFDPDTFEVVAKLKLFIDLNTCLEKGLTVSAGTIKFWMTNPDVTQEARNSCMQGTGDHTKGDGMTLSQAIQTFDKFLVDNDVSCVWGNGSASDNVWLRSAYEACGITTCKAMMFYSDRCLRTLKAVAKESGYVDNIKREGVYHDSLDDATHQVKVLKSVKEFIYGK